MAYSLPPLINGKSHEWADIIINVLGQTITDIRAIEYDETQEMENVYGAGNRPIGRVYKNIVPTAKISMLMGTVEALQALPGIGGVLQRIPEFDITVVYTDASFTTRTHTLRNCRFMKNERKSSQGDGAIIVEMDLLISHVEFV